MPDSVAKARICKRKVVFRHRDGEILGFQVVKGKPFKPEAKTHIERYLLSLLRSGKVERLPDWT